MLKVGRHKALGRLRAPIRARLKSLMFRDEVDCAETRTVVLYVELMRQTRALAHRQRTPLIMLTDYDVEEDALRAGATTFLRRSWAAADITETVARLLARRRRRD